MRCAFQVGALSGPSNSRWWYVRDVAQNRRDYIREQPIIGAPSFSPYRSWAPHRLLAIGYWLSAIGYSAASLRRAAEQLLQLFNLLAGDELFERLVVGSFSQIDFQHLLKKAG